MENENINLAELERHEVQTGIQYRSAEMQVRADEDGNGNVYEFYFSSEAPVDGRFMYSEKDDRFVYGTEVLLHGEKNVDLSWIGSGNAPFLQDHDARRQMGVITGVALDAEKKMLKVSDLKFSRKADAQDLKSDIDDGIRKNVSVGYVIEELIEVEMGVFHVTRWKPYEVSSVSIPADQGVGFRSADATHQTVVYRQIHQTKPTKPTEGERVMEPEVKIEGGVRNPAPEQNHTAEIVGQAEAARHLCPQAGELAARAIAEGVTPKDFYEKSLAPAIVAEQERQATVKIGMSKADKKRFSVVKLIRHLSGDKGVDAGYELEVSDAYASARGISAQRGGVLVPHEAMPMGRAAVISSTTGAGVVEEIHSGEVIEYLREQAVLAKAGARYISGLVGKYDMARIGVGTSAYWVGEKAETGDDITTSAMDLDLLQFTLKTVGVNQGVTRQMLKQTSSDVEAIVRGDIYAAIADAMDLAGLAGTGSGNQPTGIMYTTGVGTEEIAAANTPSYADMVNMETTVATAKALRGALAYIAHPAMVGVMKQTLRASGVAGFIAENGQVNGYPLLSSTNCVKASVNSAIFGNFSELMIGMWGGLELVADPYTYSRKGIVSLTAFQDCDIQLRHPASFVYTTVAAAG
jgi:HK97 family phage major capsid protein